MVLNGDCGRQELGRSFLKRVKGHFANEWAVVTPNGKYLSYDLDDGLKKWKALPVAERQKLEPIGAYDDTQEPAPPSKGLILQVYSRALVRNGGNLTPYKTEVSRSWEPHRDFAWLTESEWRAMIPADAKVGARHALPAIIQQRLVRRYLIDLVRVGGNGGPRRPEEVLQREMTLIVEKSHGASIEMRIEGSARLATQDVGSGAAPGRPKSDDYRLAGVVAYDSTKKAITRFDLLAFSETGHFDEVHKKVLPLAVAFQLLEGKTPAQRAAPSSWAKDYFKADAR